MNWLVLKAYENGIDQAEMSRRTGLSQSYLSHWKNIEKGSAKGLSDTVIEAVCNGLGLDARYFFDPYEGPRDYTLYLLDKAREAARHAELEGEMKELRRRLREEERLRLLAEARLESLASRVEALEGRPRTLKHREQPQPSKSR